ncbi:hypothetical protein CAL26_12455 [Bordetella genomosp. 9]|uniref:Uncharacterized protein n=1 Tax=Bordetella genomosp. 9 TaxID=1416803 RepID=A0A261R0G6_9BORD|nr:hypothetical protein [Bordetella genomosp. 9]OZI18528.1 hypothetical protein CAL26_12455 [Bordetella genomosp. 9]
MPYPLSTPLPMAPAQGFLPVFHTRHAAAPGNADNNETDVDAAGRRSGIRYDADRDGPHQAFRDGGQFTAYRREFLDRLEFIIDLCRQRRMPDAGAIEARFRTLYRHRFEADYFDTEHELPLMDSAGKRALDGFCDTLARAAARPDRQMTAIRELSLGVVVCASGIVANLIAADRELAQSLEGLCGKLWMVKEQIVREVLRQEVDRIYGSFELAEENELYYVNELWNAIAGDLGLPSVEGNPEDADECGYDAGYIAACRAKATAALAPDRIACRMAEECLSMFRGRAISDADAPYGACTAEQWSRLCDIVEDIRRDLGLTVSQLGLESFLQLHDDGRRYRVRDDPALIALALLKAMSADGLLADMPLRLADFVAGDGRHGEVFMYGALLGWRLQRDAPVSNDASARTTAGAPAAPPDISGVSLPWEAHVGAEPVNLHALRAWLADDGHAGPELWPGAPATTLQATSLDALMSIPAEWLGSARPLLGLLNRLSTQQGVEYLGHNLPYLLTDFPTGERDALLAKAIQLGEPGYVLARAWQSELWLVLQLAHNTAIRYLRDNLTYLADHVPMQGRGQWLDRIMHLGEPARDLARLWCPDPWTLLTQSTHALQGTRLEYWVGSDNVRALDAVCQMAAEGWGAGSVSRTPDRVAGSSVSTPQGRACGWCLDEAGRVAVSRDPATIDAARRLLRQLSFGSPASERYGRRLSDLFPSNVLYVLEAGEAARSRAFRGLLLDPQLLPRIGPDLPSILYGSGAYPGYPMSYVLATGKKDFIVAYGTFLADMANTPDGARWIARLLMPKWLPEPEPAPGRGRVASPHGDRPGCHALLDACIAGATQAIEAYHQVLAHPAILPHVRHVLPELVLAAPPIDPKTGHRRWPEARYEILDRLFNMSAPGYPAYRDLVRDPAILPHIVDAVPLTAIIIRARLEGRGVKVEVDAHRPSTGVRSPRT